MTADPKSAALAYQQANPLGGPAKVFRAMADAIEAGDSYEETLRRYRFAEVTPSPAEVDELDVERFVPRVPFAGAHHLMGEGMAQAAGVPEGTLLYTGQALRKALRAALASQAQPKGTACVDPMCACRCGPCAECPEGEREKELADLKAQALALCHALEEQPGSQYQTAAVLAAFKVYRAFESIEKHGEIRQWVFDVAAPAVQAPQYAEAVEDLMTKIQAFGLACYQHESGAEQISMQDEIRIDLAALAGASSAWQPIETAPKDAQLLLAAEFDHPGDWRIKMGYFDSKTAKWAMWGASWRPTRWMRLPPGPGAAVQAPAPAPSAARLTQDGKLHVTAWQCHGCGHRGIDDGDDAAEACSDCNWRGPCPDEDVCPGCGREGTMVSACPKCGDRYYIKAEADIVIPTAAQAPAVGATDGMLEPLIYAAIMHNGTPKTVAEFERAARTVAEMLERRTPEGREWRGLTTEERASFVNEICDHGTGFVAPLFSLAESLEEVLKARNSASPAALAQAEADAKDATRYQALRGTLGVNSFTYAPRITDPSNEWLTYTPDGLDKVCDEMAAALAAKKPASNVPVQPTGGA